MLAQSPIRHIFKHDAAINVQPSQHHIIPQNFSIQNTSQSIEPLPGGPGYWDIPIPFDSKLAALTLSSGWQANDVGGKRGGRWLVTRTAYLEATGMSFGGPTSWINGSYPGAFSKARAHLEISHRIWTTSGQYISMTDAYLAQTGPSSRVLRIELTNYGYAYYTVTIYGEVQIIG